MLSLLRRVVFVSRSGAEEAAGIHRHSGTCRICKELQESLRDEEA